MPELLTLEIEGFNHQQLVVDLDNELRAIAMDG